MTYDNVDRFFLLLFFFFVEVQLEYLMPACCIELFVFQMSPCQTSMLIFSGKIKQGMWFYFMLTKTLKERF